MINNIDPLVINGVALLIGFWAFFAAGWVRGLVTLAVVWFMINPGLEYMGIGFHL